MLTSLFSDPMRFVSTLLLFVVSIGLHEFGHAIVADRLGDPTPRSEGRVTLNPLVHLDMFGTLLLVLVGFGWGKPVMTRPHHFKSPRWGSLAVSIAGPAVNFLLALVGILAVKHLPGLTDAGSQWFITLFTLNVFLMVLNLLPLPPLDGGHVLEALLPRAWVPGFQKLVPYGAVALLVIAFLPGADGPLRALNAVVLGWMASLG